MVKKQESKKSKKAEILLTPEESREFQMIMDRLAVQDPEGESLENCLQSLRRAMAGRENLIAVLVEKLSRNPSPVGFRVFLALEGLVVGKEHRRVMKQAGYRFAQKGYVKGTEEASEQTVVLIPKEARKAVAHLVPADEAPWFVAAFFPGEEYHPVPVAVSAFAVKDFQEISVRVVESSQKLYRDFIRKLAGHLPKKPYEVPIKHAARIYFELLQFHKGPAAVPEAERAKQLFLPFYDPESPPYAYEVMPVIEEPERHLAELDLQGLFEALNLTVLSFSKDDLAPYMQQVEDLERSVLVVPQEIKQERATELVKKAADELCQGNTRFLFQRFFEEQALRFRLSGKEDLARSAWIIAQHLRGKAEASQNPMVTRLVAMSMELHWPEEFEGEERETGPFQETESGIIIPR